MIRAAKPDEFTQGTLFSCATAQAYQGSVVSGLIITARCDAAQDKTDIYNYLPVVDFDSWLFRDGTEILIKRLKADSDNSMRKALEDGGLHASIVDTLDHDLIEAELDRIETKQAKVIAARFRKARHQLMEVADCEAKLIYEINKSLSANYINQSKSIIKELLSNSLIDFHYIEGCQPNEISDGYVIRLREVRLLPSVIVSSLRRGLDFDGLNEISAQGDPGLSIERDEFAMPLGVIESPYIELIMQRFTQLFARIGVRDTPKNKLLSLQGKLLESAGEVA